MRLGRGLNTLATGLRPIPWKVLVVPVRLEQGARMVTLARGQLAVEVWLSPLTIRLARRGRWLIQGLMLFAQDWSGGDRLIHLTEGVMVEEERDEPVWLAEAELRGRDGAGVELGGKLADGEPFELRVSIADDERVTIEFDINHRLLGNHSAESLGLRPTFSAGLGAGRGFRRSDSSSRTRSSVAPRRRWRPRPRMAPRRRARR